MSDSTLRQTGVGSSVPLSPLTAPSSFPTQSSISPTQRQHPQDVLLARVQALSSTLSSNILSFASVIALNRTLDAAENVIEYDLVAPKPPTLHENRGRFYSPTQTRKSTYNSVSIPVQTSFTSPPTDTADSVSTPNAIRSMVKQLATVAAELRLRQEESIVSIYTSKRIKS